MPRVDHSWLTRKTLLLILGALLSAFLLLAPHQAKAYGYDWDISSFDTSITANEDGFLLVRETIVADFSRESHHGIYRTIPVVYRDATNHTLKLRYNVVSVKDQNGNDWWYETSREGDYLKIKAGDADRLFQEPLTFVISYEIQRAVSFQFDDHDEIYWNATGDEWEVPIHKATASITLPAAINENDIRATCYTGKFGATTQNCDHQISGNTISYEALGSFNPYEGLTIVAGFPKGIITPAPLWQQVQWFLMDNWPYALPILTLLGLLYLWYTRGRDPQTNRDTVMPHYEPADDLTPAETGTLIDERVDMHDLSATIVDLAVRGFIKIREEKKKKFLFGEEYDYEFMKLKDYKEAPELHDHEKKTLDAIFGGGDKKKLSDLKNQFYKDLPIIKNAIYDALVEKNYFPQSPEKIRNTYMTTGGILLFGPLFFAGLFIELGSIALPLSLVISGAIVLAFARIMPAKTKKGVESYYRVLGLEEYIRTAEADRIKFQEKENMFMKLLPFAMAFGIVDRWSKAFEGLHKVPNWYESNDPTFADNFNALYFTNRLTSMSSQMNSTFTSSPRSSGSSGFGGGGSSGGGFGGGGGGSW